MNMEKQAIINEVKKYFCIQEFVSKSVYDKFGEKAWNFLDEKLLHTILVIRRDILKVGLVCNDWKFGGKNQQRGLRENICQIAKEKTLKGQLYLSAHLFGKAVDFVSSKMSANDMRKTIAEKAYLLPYPIRIESGSSAPTWLHFDVVVDTSPKSKITLFS